MPNRVGPINVNQGTSAAEIVESTLSDSPIARGTANEISEFVQSSQDGGSYTSEGSGYGGGGQQEVPGSTTQTEPAQEQPSRIFQREKVQMEIPEGTSASSLFNLLRPGSDPATKPVSSTSSRQDNSSSSQVSSRASSSVVAETSATPAREDGQDFGSPASTQPASSGFSASDLFEVETQPKAGGNGNQNQIEDDTSNITSTDSDSVSASANTSSAAYSMQDFETNRPKHVQAEPFKHIDISDTTELITGAASVTGTDDNVLSEPSSVQEKTPLQKFKDVPNNIFRKTIRDIKEFVEKATASKDWSGRGFTEKVLASRDVDPDSISVGSQVIAEIVREPGNNLIQIVNEATGLNFTADQLIDPRGMKSFIDAINQSEIYVVLAKHPVPNPESTQTRRMVVHLGRGAKIHPSQTTIFNLDFDGDPVVVQFTADEGLFRNAMECLISSSNEPMLDLDFFPVGYIVEDKSEFVARFRSTFLIKLFSDNVNTDELAGNLYDLMYEDGDKDEQARKFIRSMNDVASFYSNKNVVMSYILKDIFDTMLLAKRMQVETMVEIAGDPLADIIEMPADYSITKVINDISYGNLPPNFQDFLVGLGRYIGEVPGKNVVFRLGADVAKRIKFSGVLVKGEVGARELYNLTLEAGMAAFMNNRTNIGEKLSYVQQMMRESVINVVGFPDDARYENINQWLYEFIKEYNRMQGILDMAQVKFGCDLDPDFTTIKDNRITKDTLVDVVRPLVSIYGKYTVDRMFPNAFSYRDSLVMRTEEGGTVPTHMKGRTLLRRYKRSTLSKLSRDNRIPADYKQLEKIKTRNCTATDIVLAIADLRSQKASKFNNEVDELLKNFTSGFIGFSSRYRNKDNANDGRYWDSVADFASYCKDLMACFHLSGPDMFAYFGMENPSSFVNSKWGDLFTRALSVPGARVNGKLSKADLHIGGIRMAMVVQYRMRHVNDINKEIDKLGKQEGILPYASTRINELQNRVLDELYILGSSSDLWHVLTQEVAGNTTAFDTLIENKGETLGSFCDAKDFWEKGFERYKSLMDVMKDPYIDKESKSNIAVDVVRQATGFHKLKSYEMSYQLEIGPHSAYTNLSTLAYRDQPNVINDLEESNNRFRQLFEQDWSNIRDDVIQAEQTANDGDLNSYIKYLADNPQAYIEIDDNLIVDAINVQMEKSSRSAEKASQEGPVNILYNALSLMKGGLTNAMYRSDSRVLGMVPEDMLSPYDLVQVLANPDFSLTVYNGRQRYLLSRRALCGDNSEKALWEMLKNNPRIAALLRPSIATVAGDSAYRSGKAKFSDGVLGERSKRDVLRGKVKSELIDHPMFLAMVAMFKPINMRHSRSVRQETKYTLNAMQTIIIGLAKDVINRKSDKKKTNAGIDASAFLNRMGVSVESLQSVGGMDSEAAENWFNDMSEALNRYVVDVVEIIESGAFYSQARALSEESVDVDPDLPFARLRFDKSSVELAVDVRQTMTGAKTETSTAVEGAMTEDNLGLGLWAMSMRDTYIAINDEISNEELELLVGCMTNAGIVFDGNNLEQIEEALPVDIPVVVQVPLSLRDEDGNPIELLDTTLNNDLREQIPALGRFAIMKRTRAAEKYNLKAKKTGDDGLDSITKVDRYIANSSDNIGIVENVYQSSEDKENALMFATLKLASILQRADIAEGYDDMDLGDYANIASAMIEEVTNENGEKTIVIRSLDEVSRAIRMNLDQDVVDNGTPKDIIKNAREIAKEVGKQPMVNTPYTALIALSSIKTSTDLKKFRAGNRASMSSADRSYEMMEQLTGEEHLKLPWSGRTKKPATAIASARKIKAKKKQIAKRIPFNIFKTNYNVIGVIDSNGVDVIDSPGQLSVWYLKNGASQKDIDYALRRCYAYGMTLAFENIEDLGDKAGVFERDITPAPFGEDLVMLPFFDMRMNKSSISGAMMPFSGQYNPSWLWTMVEDSQNLYGLGDADALSSKHLAETTQCVAGGNLSISFDDVFYNARKAYPDTIGSPKLCNRGEIERLIVNWQDNGPTIDFGITDVNPNFNKILRKFGLQLQEYRNNFYATDENGFLHEAAPDRIVGWVKCSIPGHENPVYAPIIPWPVGHGISGPKPTRFTIGEDLKDAIDSGTDSFVMPWSISEDIEGQYCKVHDGMGAAGKMMTFLSRSVDLGNLRTGRPIDLVVAAESLASRRLAWGKRMCTLKTLAMTMTLPPYGYNYAEHDSSFPDVDRSDPNNVKDRLISERIPIEEWPGILETCGRLSADDGVNAILTEMVDLALKVGTNPSDILATKIGNDYSYMYVDYDFFFDTSLSFQNRLMTWYNMMQPDVCPPTIDDYYNHIDGKGYMFRPVTSTDNISNEYEIGCLQMSVPHEKVDGSGVFWRWENVYISFSFFNDDYSGIHRIGLNGSHKSLGQIDAMALTGKWLSGKDMRQYARNTASPSFKTFGPNDIELDYSNFISGKRRT